MEALFLVSGDIVVQLKIFHSIHIHNDLKYYCEHCCQCASASACMQVLQPEAATGSILYKGLLLGRGE